jgi:hypothetical protein
MPRGGREVDTPCAGILRCIQAREVDQAFRIFGSSPWTVGDNGKVTCELAVELHPSDGIPARRVKEEERAACDSKPVPNKIPAANMVKFVSQNVFQLGTTLPEAKFRQQDDRANGAEGSGRRNA